MTWIAFLSGGCCAGRDVDHPSLGQSSQWFCAILRGQQGSDRTSKGNGRPGAGPPVVRAKLEFDCTLNGSGTMHFIRRYQTC